jgi:hypothetical protein
LIYRWSASWEAIALGSSDDAARTGKGCEAVIERGASDAAASAQFGERQINKVRGILTFDGIFFVVARIYANELGGASALLVRAALSYILISIGISLILFIVRWGDISAYREFRTEFSFAAQQVRKRTLWVNYAAILSLLSALAVSALMILSAHARV